MQKVKFSKHALYDREDRIVWISTKVGFGKIVDTIFINDNEHGQTRIELTETGVAILKAVEEEFVVTMYLPTTKQLIHWYGNKNTVPVYLLNVAKRNEKRGWAGK